MGLPSASVVLSQRGADGCVISSPLLIFPRSAMTSVNSTSGIPNSSNPLTTPTVNGAGSVDVGSVIWCRLRDDANAPVG
jgi:hypothetical protein